MTQRWEWRKSSRSATNGACVEIGTSTDTAKAAVRDSKSGDGSPILTVGRAQIGAFLHVVKDGKLA